MAEAVIVSSALRTWSREEIDALAAELYADHLGHGRRSTYNNPDAKCRCGPCCAASGQYLKDWKARA